MYIYIGKKVRVSAVLPVLVWLFVRTAGAGTAAAALIAVALHETAHIAAGRILGLKIDAAALTACGADISYRGAVPYAADIGTALSGPAVGIISGALLYRLYPSFSVVSVIYGIINLLPVYGFDGGRAFSAAVHCAAGYETADRICGAVHAVFLLLLYPVAVFFLFYTSYNASYLLLAAYVFVSSYVRKNA